jgi:hypothetical protein
MTVKPIDDKRLAAQLRSVAGRKAALDELDRHPPTALPDEVAAALRELLVQDDAASVRDDVLEAIMRHPTEALRDVYEQIACRELPYRRARAIELLPMWMRRVAMAEAPNRILAAAATADHAWLLFLAAVQSARLGVDGGDGWQRAAKAIIASRTPDPMRCIRPQAEEQLDADERALVNAELRMLGAREL